MPIYIVEDDDNIRELEAFAMKNSGYDTECFESSKEFYNAIVKAVPDLILLDIMLPGDDGLTILKKLRDDPVTANIPVIIISAKTTELDRVKGLDLGADDYLAKPFKTAELIARLNALVRRPSLTAAKVKEFGDLTLDKTNRTLNGVELTDKEFGIIEALLQKPGATIAKEQLLARVWGADAEFEENYVEVYISYLRKKLKKLNSKVGIGTLRSLGYRLVVGE